MKSKKIFLSVIFSLILTLSLSFIVSADTTTSIPSKPSEYYLDLAGVFSDDTLTSVSDYNADLSEGEIYIVSVTGTGTMTIGEYANEIYDEWEIGGSDNTGILFLVNMDTESDSTNYENYYAIAAGAFAENFDNGSLETMLKNYVEPSFAIGEYDSAVSYFLTQSFNMTNSSSTSTDTETDTDSTEEETSIIASIFKVIVTILVIIIILSAIGIGIIIFLNYNQKKRNKLRKANRKSKANIPNKTPDTLETPSEFLDDDFFDDIVIDEDGVPNSNSDAQTANQVLADDDEIDIKSENKTFEDFDVFAEIDFSKNEKKLPNDHDDIKF